MMLRRAAVALVLPLALAGCGDLLDDLDLPGFGRKDEAATAATPPAAAQPPAVSPLEVPIEVTGAQKPVGTANAETVNVAAFTARGNQPAWWVSVNGDKALLKREGARDATITVNRVNFAQGVEFAGTLGGAVFSLTVRAGTCKDSLSGTRWPMSATVRWGGQGYAGCAAPAGGEPEMPAAQAATTAPKSAS